MKKIYLVLAMAVMLTHYGVAYASQIIFDNGDPENFWWNNSQWVTPPDGSAFDIASYSIGTTLFSEWHSSPVSNICADDFNLKQNSLLTEVNFSVYFDEDGGGLFSAWGAENLRVVLYSQVQEGGSAHNEILLDYYEENLTPIPKIGAPGPSPDPFPIDWHMRSYNFSLDTPILLDANTQYFLGLQADTSEAEKNGFFSPLGIYWAKSQAGYGSDAYQATSADGWAWSQLAGANLAFNLVGEAVSVPEPASILLFATVLAGLLGSGLRRKD